MVAKILLITFNDGFGELLRQALVDNGGYDVILAESGVRALQHVQETRFDMTILDCQVDDIPPGEIAGALSDWHPGMPFIVVPPENNPAHLRLADLSPHAFLTKPFYLPDMLKIVQKVLEGNRVDVEKLTAVENIPSPRKTRPESEGPPDDPAGGFPLPWLQDLDIAAQHLARLSLESAAKAALIAQGDRLFAYAGEFPQPLASELARTVGQHWNRRRGSDLAQFVKLDDGNEYMLYATHLVDELVLALIFDAKMPFSKIRTQANRLAQALSSDEDERPGNKGPPSGGSRSTPSNPRPIPDDWIMITPNPEEMVGIGDTQENPVLPAGIELEMQEQPGAAAEEDSLDWLPSELTEDTDRLFDQTRSDPDLAGIDIPADWQPTSGEESGSRSFLENLLGDPLPSVKFPYEIDQPPSNPPEHTQPSRKPDPDEVARQQSYLPSPESMAETRPTPIPNEGSSMAFQLEPESSSYFHATYACVLVPRLPQHHLVRDLAKILEDSMPQICVSFDWRIEQLAIRPDYMQWIVRVHSATAPHYLMQIITKITSDKIFYNLPRLADENPSGEFWAPGWLVIGGEKMPPPRMVQEFIHKTRRRQGLG